MANEQFVIRLGVDSAGVNRGSNSAISSIERIYKSAQGLASKFNIGGILGGVIGGGIAGGIMGALNGALGEVGTKIKEWIGGDVIDRFKELKNLMAETGLNGDQLQPFKKTLEGVGLTAQDGARALEHLAENIVKIKDGEDKDFKIQRQLADLGVSLETIKRGDYRQMFFQIAESLKGVQLDDRTTSALKGIFGRGGVALMPAFQRGFDNPLSTSANFSDEDLSAQAKLLRLKNQNSFKKQIEEFKNQISMLGTRAQLYLYQTLDKLSGGEGVSAEQDRTSAKRIEMEDQRRINTRNREAKRELDDLKEKNDEREKELKLANMTDSERRKALQTEKEELEIQINKTSNEMEREKLRKKLIEVDGKLGKKPSFLDNGKLDQTTDALAQIGGYRGGGGEFSRVQDQQLSVQREMASSLRRIADSATERPVSPEVQQTIRGLNSLVSILTGQGGDL